MESNLQDWLYKRRSKFYEGELLDQRIAEFMSMVDAGAKVLEYPGAIIVLQDIAPDVVRAWLLFDKFTRETVRGMRDVSDKFKGLAIVAETHDPRIKDLLVKIGYQCVDFDGADYHLIKWGAKNGL